VETHRPLDRLAQIVSVLLILNAVAALASLGSLAAQLELLGRIELGDYTQAELDANDTREMLFGLAAAALYLATAVVFLMWFKRAYDNVRAFGHTPAHGTGWAIGAWFVPILNLFRPFQIAREIWNASDGGDEEGSLPGETPTVLGLWWAAWIAGNIAGQVSFRVSMRADSPSDFSTSTIASMVSELITLVSAPLAVMVVRRITARQSAAVDVAPVEF